MPGKSKRFFKIILMDVGSHTKLLIPDKFLNTSGKNLNNSIILIAPTGLEWSIDLERLKGKVWLQNGWPEFAKFYSIGFGYLLVFEYKGDSKFEVLIFDPSSLEIDYPLARNDELNSVELAEVEKRLSDVHHSSSSNASGSLDDSSSSDYVSSDDSSSSDYVVRPSKKRKAKSTSSEASATLQQKRAKVANKVDKGRAPAVANAFISKNPFFVHAMKESHLVGGGWPNVYIPKTFKEAYTNWKNNEKVVLNVARGSWVVFCKLNLQCNQHRISAGWNAFARDNSLNVGDVCVFELIDSAKKLFQVFISRAAKDTNCDENNRLPRVRSQVDKARVRAIVKDFKPKNPSFVVEVYKCYLYGGSITLPKKFIEEHVTEGSCKVILRIMDGRTWPVKCYILKKCAKFSAGWKKFSQENNLAAGDVCGFELVNRSERLFNVVIFRQNS